MRTRNFIVAFSRTPAKKFWWRFFVSRYHHCFIYTHIGTDVVRIENAYGGTQITVDNEMAELNRNDVDHLLITVPETPQGKHRSPICTCAGFCATFIGLKGFILTPDQLYRRIKSGRSI